MSGTDFLRECTTAATGNPVLDQIRDKSADVVLALYRFLKTTLVHAMDNDAVKEAAKGCASILGGFAAEVGAPATITLTEDSTFVCGQLLRASRSVYESATELGVILGKVGVSEVCFENGVTPADVLAAGQAFVLAARDAEKRNELLVAKIPHITLRSVDVKLTKRRRDDDLPVHERVVRLYATAIVVMRGFYADIARGVTILPHKVKRLAQRLVALGDVADVTLLGMTAMARAHRDDAGRAVQTAILVLALGRQITRDRVVLSRLVMAALLADVGRAGVLGSERREQLVPLTEAEEARVPAATAVASVATGGVNPSNASRTVMTVEAAWSERRALLHDPWGGALTPLLGSQILTLVTEILDRLAPRDTRRPLSPVDALEAVLSSSKADRVLLRLLVRAVGLVPTGTVVELTTGEWAVVAGPSKTKPHLMVLRVVTDKQGHALDNPVTLDLADATTTTIAKVIDPERARFNVTRAFLAS